MNKKNFSGPDDFNQKMIEKVEKNFLNDDFMKKILEIHNSSEYRKEHESFSLFDKIIKFSHECYIHGVSAGMNAAIEIYEEYDK